MLGRADSGVVESEPLSLGGKVLVMVGFVVFPLAWGFGFFLGHRFNEGRWAYVPFLVNFVPLIGVFWFVWLFAEDEGGGDWWVVVYVFFLKLLLATGIFAVWRSKGGLSSE